MSSQFPVFAKYHVERQLGEGGMGFVLLARSRENSRWVALKILRPEFNGMRWRFEREARIMKQLRDAGVSNIVTIYDYGVANDGQHHYIAMDYIDNGSLKDVLKGRLFTIQETYSILRMILPPLHHAHQMDIFHRDLKPSNILIDRQGQAYLADFGVATDPDLNNPQTKLMNAVIGTPAYMSPEAHKGFKVTPADEVYSIGVTAFEMLVGKVPRELDRDKAFHYIPQNLVPVIYMATRSARENRYATIEAFWRAFDQAARQPTQPPLIDPLTLTGRRPQPSYTQVPAGDSIPKRPENFVGGNAGQQQNRVPLLSGTRSTLRAGDNVGLRWMGGMVIVLALVGILGLGGWVYQENFNSANAATREVLQVASSSTAQAQTLAAVPTRTTIPTSSPTRRPTVVPTRRPSATPARPNNLNYRGALLQEGESDPYNIPLTRGETITVQMNADNDSFDTYLYLYNSRGLLIAADDDSGSGLNSVLTYTVTATGDYQILASSYDGDGLGSYELLIEINR